MPTIKIDGRAVEVADGATVLAAARQIGIHIPTICFGGNGCPPSASCLVCAVKLSRTGQMVPSCAVQVADGMEVESQTAEVEEVQQFMVVADPVPRTLPSPTGRGADQVSTGGRLEGADSLTREEAMREAGRCCRCDCRKADNCRLRQAAEQLGARRNRYAAPRERSTSAPIIPWSSTSPASVFAAETASAWRRRPANRWGWPSWVAGSTSGLPPRWTTPCRRPCNGPRECVEACPTAALALKLESDRQRPQPRVGLDLASPPRFVRKQPAAEDRYLGQGTVRCAGQPRPSIQPHAGTANPRLAEEDLGAAREASEPTREVQWIEPVIPCQSACPAHTRIPEYLAAVARGEFDAAYKINLQDNVFSAVLGRVCARPCEAACRHGRPSQGEPLAICFSKRAAADFFAGDPVTLAPLFDQPTGKRVAVIGAGVAGLTVARELARCGHTVTVLEKHVRPGGMLNQGIPAFRLPRNIVDREIEQVRRCGVEIRSGVEVGKDVTLTDLLAQHDAVVLAGGTLRRNRLDLPGGDLAGIRHGLDFLLEVNEQRLTIALRRRHRDWRGVHGHGLRPRGQTADQRGGDRLLPAFAPRDARDPRRVGRTGARRHPAGGNARADGLRGRRQRAASAAFASCAPHWASPMPAAGGGRSPFPAANASGRPTTSSWRPASSRIRAGSTTDSAVNWSATTAG